VSARDTVCTLPISPSKGAVPLTYRKRSLALAVSVASFLALTASALGATTGAAATRVSGLAPKPVPKPTVVTVTAGSPSELVFTLSKFSNLPVGKITFKVTNKGAITHDFEVCSAPFVGAIVFSCAGKTTPMIQPGKSAVLTLTLAKGKYEYLCSVPGHASAGMKGFFGVGVKIAAPVTPTLGGSTTPTPPPISTTTTTTAAQTCANPQSSSVTVSMFDFGYTASPSTVPCGTITFTVNNTGNTDHDFVIEGLIGSNGRTNLLSAGQSQTITTTLSPGTWTYYCSVPTHRALGMEGKLIVNK
jgi:uncharacterized cupredoxin-like copper-binding protein